MGSPDMKQSTIAGMVGMQRVQLSGDTHKDKDFAMLNMHHQQALDMAKKIILGKKNEIAWVNRCLAKQQ